LSDSRQGRLRLSSKTIVAGGREYIEAQLGMSSGAGDETVPVRSADHQLASNKFAGVFRQFGYEHQGSYDDQKVLDATVYSIVKIAARMTWRKNEAS
jgi:hypothetical protein